MPACGLRIAAAAAVVIAGGVLVSAQARTVDRAKANGAVVKVVAYGRDVATYGTGFAWDTPRRVVTALHVVAGLTVEVRTDSGRGIGASVEGVNRAADLALLALDEDIGLKPLEVEKAQVGAQYNVWGYPLGVQTMQDNVLRVSNSQHDMPTLLQLFGTEQAVARVVGEQGYPAARARILRIGSTLTHGQSGAPILSRAGRVVGIANGGLDKGAAGVNWAIDAREYLTKSPWQFTSDLPQAVSRVAHRDRPVGVRATGAGGDGISVDSIGGDPSEQLPFVLSFSATLGEILETLAENDPGELDREDILSVVDPVGSPVLGAMIDVYVDTDTGATIALPSDLSFTYDGSRRRLSGTVGAVSVMFETASRNAANARPRFDAAVRARGDWADDAVGADRSYRTVTASYSSQRRRLRDAPNGVARDGGLERVVLISGNAFLGAVVTLDGSRPVTVADRWMFQLLTACARLSAFAIR